MQSEYPFQQDWPIEGFPLNHGLGNFVQIRAISTGRARPPYKGYPQTTPGRSSYDWWEVHLCFRPYSSESVSPDGSYITITGKSGRTLKERNFSRCIARFKTKDEAYAFIHKLHQSEKKENFWNE